MKNLLTKTKKIYLLLPLLLVLVSNSFAATFYVGTCHSSSYPTISAAVAAVPPNSTIDVCPGVYPEQVFISQPLTLQGIKSGNNDRARIVVPSSPGGGINWTFVPDPEQAFLQVAPQIFVNSPTGPVKISNLTIDASGETTAQACTIPGYWLTTAIFYEDSSGTVNEVNTVGQGKNSGCGVGIRAAAVAASGSVTITNNSIQDTNYIGLHVESPLANAASLTVNVSHNTLVLGSGPQVLDGIEFYGVTGTIASNSIEAPTYGITELFGKDVGPLTVSNNMVHASHPPSPGWGMQVSVASAYLQTVSGNKVVDFYGGISLTPVPSPVTVIVKSNVIANSHLGIDLRCVSETLSGNIINNAATGIDNAPGGVLPAGVSFYNVDQVMGSGSCP